MTEEKKNVMAPLAEGEILDEGTDLIPFDPGELSFDKIMRRDGVAPGIAVRCSYDAATGDGPGFLARASVSQAGQDSKLPFFGKSFKMVAWTSIIRVQKKDKTTGEMLPEPRPLIRTVIECDDGAEIAFASSYIFADLQQIGMAHPDMSVKKPVECILYKGGQSDRLKDVKASAKRVIK